MAEEKKIEFLTGKRRFQINLLLPIIHDFVVQPLQNRYWIPGLGNGPANDQVIRTVFDCFPRSCHPFLLIRRRIGRPNSRGNQTKGIADPVPQLPGFKGGTYHPIQAAVMRQQSKALNRFPRVSIQADFVQIFLAEAGKKGNGYEPGFAGGYGIPGRQKHFSSSQCVDIQHPYAQLRRRPAGARNRVGDIVKFQVEEDIEPLAHDAFHQLRPGGGEKLFPYLDSA
jgi:hypothetical protein